MPPSPASAISPRRRPADRDAIARGRDDGRILDPGRAPAQVVVQVGSPHLQHAAAVGECDQALFRAIEDHATQLELEPIEHRRVRVREALADEADMLEAGRVGARAAHVHFAYDAAGPTTRASASRKALSARASR
jgi:hypothetical protein